jgi:hypothetical protein
MVPQKRARAYVWRGPRHRLALGVQPQAACALLVGRYLVRGHKPCHAPRLPAVFQGLFDRVRVAGHHLEQRCGGLVRLEAALRADEALPALTLDVLRPALERQPVWSDFPLLLLTSSAKATEAL